MEWIGWPLARFVVLFVALAYLLIGTQVTMSHYRQNFRHKAMLAPVLLSPCLLLAGLAAVWIEAEWIAVVLMALLWAAVAVGLIGFVLHVRGVGKRVGGYAPRNFLMGPPAALPLTFAAVAVLGLVAVYGTT